MKKLIFCLLAGVSLNFSFGNAMSALDNAITRAYTKKLTSFLATEDFKPNNSIRRDEAAKFFVNFAKLVGKTKYTVNANQCQFSDLNKAWSDLRNIITESCKLGIFKGTKGKFNPTDNLTNAEAIAVLMRIVDGNQSEKWVSHRSDNYYQRANALSLLSEVDMNNKSTNATRGNVISLLYKARNMKGINEKDIRDIGDGNISLTNDQERGIIKQVYTDPNGIKKIEIDFVQIIPCSESYCTYQINSEWDWWDYILVNENKKLRTFPITSSTTILLTTGYNYHTYATYVGSFEELSEKMKDLGQYLPLFIFTIQNGNITHMTPPTTDEIEVLSDLCWRPWGMAMSLWWRGIAWIGRNGHNCRS